MGGGVPLNGRDRIASLLENNFYCLRIPIFSDRGGDGPTLVRNIFEYFRRSWLDGSFVDKSRRSSQEGPRSHLSSEARCAVNIAASRLCWRSSYVASRSVSFAGICAARCILQSGSLAVVPDTPLSHSFGSGLGLRRSEASSSFFLVFLQFGQKHACFMMHLQRCRRWRFRLTAWHSELWALCPAEG